jgi:beta-barrel assembly-enhancing protease
MKKWLCLLALLGQTIGMAAANDLPDFGSPADSVLNKTREGQLGRSVMMQLYNAGVVVEDPLLAEYIQSIGAEIASHANNGSHRFRFFVVDDNRINAFAMPGGYIGIHTGLILASDNESELAGVLAHEVSHVTQRHIARSIYDSQRTSIMSMAAMLAAVLLGAATDMPGDALAGVISASQAAALQRQINYTRAHEHEADRVGIEVLAAAGFDPNAMGSFFEKLSRRYGVAQQNIPEMLQTHPVTANRIAEARDRARRLPQNRVTDSVSYSLAKARAEWLSARDPQTALRIFESNPDSGAAPNRYGRALALSSLGRHDDAERIFRELVAEHPAVIAYRIGLGETLAGSGLSDQAMEVFAEAVRLFPRNVPLTIAYAEALIDADAPADAHRLLLDLLNNVPPTPTQIRLIARAANAEGDTLNAYYYMGEYYLSIGNLPLAISQLRLALELPDAHAVQRARLNARLDEIMEFLPEEQRGEGARRSGRRSPSG